MGLSTKPQKLNQVPFVEGNDCQQILFQIQKACKKVLINIAGTITITNLTGVVVPVLQPASDGTELAPYILPLAGKLNFNGETLDQSKGFTLNNIPMWLLWLEAYILNKGVGPVVSDGGMKAAGFAAGTYNISMNIPIYFYDPMTPAKQHSYTFFRPVTYNKQPYFLLTGGKLFQAEYQAGNDNVALTGDATVPSSLTYTMSLQVTSSAYLVPALKMTSGDKCANPGYEYISQFNLNQTQYNQIGLANLEVQAYIHMINTNRALANGGAGAYTESGADSFGLANNGIVETDIGTDPIALAYAVNIKAQDYDEFMTSVSAIPAGYLVIDEYDHDWSKFQYKTFLQPGIATHFLQSNGTVGPNGSNLRIFHKCWNLSASAKSAVGTFPKFAGQ